MESITDNQRVAAYLNQRLTKEETFVYEQDLKKNQLLRQAHEQAVATQKILDTLAHEQLRTKLQSIAANSPQKTTRLFYSFPKLAGIAAAILVLFLAGWIGFGQANYSNDALIANYMERPNSTTIRGTENTPLENISLLIQQGDDEQAIQQLANIQPAHPAFIKAQTLLGMLYLKTEQFNKAKTTLQAVAIRPPSPFYEEVTWHLLLLDLQENNLSTVHQQLNFVLESADFSPAIKTKAASLKQDLESVWRVWE